ncbi:MAG: VWA domain-containing protein [Blastocatellia bacterium]
MKLKAVRASLAAVLTATLLISVLPISYAQTAAGQTQGENSSRPRRGKNGEPVTRTSYNDQTPQKPASPKDSSSEAAKSASVPPSGQQDNGSSDKSAQVANHPANAGATQDWSGPPQHRDAPPFDRPSLGTRGRTRAEQSQRSSEASQPDRQTPSYSGADSSSRPASRDRLPSQSSSSGTVHRQPFPDTPAGGGVDADRGDRSSGQPPVLNRPSDSRSRDENRSTDGRPPVLRRPSDPQQGNDGRSSDSSSGRSSRPAQPDGSTPAPAGGDDEVIKLESTLVNMPLLVSDRSGRYIPQLSARDFALYEDGVQQTIASFGTEEVPFSVVLLLDVSPSVQGNVQDIQDAAIAFVRQLRGQDRVMVASFDRSIHYLSDFTSDRRELEWAIRKADTGSGTSVYDAVFEAVQRKLRNVEGRKALILFSDGEDTTSGRASYDDAVNIVAESDVLVYGLRYPGNGGRGGINVPSWPRSPIPGVQLPFPFPFPWPRRRRGPFRMSNWAPTANSAVTQSWPRRGGRGGDFMADVTAAGGGPVYDAEKISDLSRVANRIAEELRHVYVVSYYPTNPLSKGGYRSVRVSVKGRDDIAVRHRRGYNARPNGTGKPTI